VLVARKQAAYNHTPVPCGLPALDRRGSSCRSQKPSADRRGSQALQSAKAKWVRLPQATINKYPTRRSRTFVLVVGSLVLPHELVALRLHILDVIVILGEGGVQL
jgi:hypothetical protein